MAAFSCAKCQKTLEFATPPAEQNGVVPCPVCGGPLAPVEERESNEGVLQSALDELIERPGVRFFCNAMSSIVVHVGIFSLFFMVTWVAQAAIAEEEKPADISGAIAVDDRPNDGNGFKFQGKLNQEDREDGKQIDPTKPVIDKPIGEQMENDQTSLNKALTDAKSAGAGPTANLSGAGAADSGANAAGLIGRGGSSGSAGSGRGGGGNGSGFGNGNRPGGGEVFGVGGLPGAKSIVYVVDRSGSMDPVGDFMKTELSKAVNKLVSTQKFNVIWFSEGDPYVLATNLVAATEENKSRLFKFLQDVKLQGSTDPRSALFKALDLKPELIYILTDGNFEPEFVEQVTKKNVGKIRINAIGFVLPGGEGHGNLQKITEQNRGKFKAIDVKQLTGGN
jgi:hypothetical protein